MVGKLASAGALAMLFATGVADAAYPPALFGSVDLYTGGSPAASELKAPLDGTKKSVTIVHISSFYHEMNLPPGFAQPIGLATFFSILKVSESGPAATCEEWVRIISAAEAAWYANTTGAKPRPFPYLAISVTPSARPVGTFDGGFPIYRESDVKCWEASDLGLPLY